MLWTPGAVATHISLISLQNANTEYTYLSRKQILQPKVNHPGSSFLTKEPSLCLGCECVWEAHETLLILQVSQLITAQPVVNSNTLHLPLIGPSSSGRLIVGFDECEAIRNVEELIIELGQVCGVWCSLSKNKILANFTLRDQQDRNKNRSVMSLLSLSATWKVSRGRCEGAFIEGRTKTFIFILNTYVMRFIFKSNSTPGLYF